MVVTADNIKNALCKAVDAIYFNDNSDYESALWGIIRELGGQEAVDLLEQNPKAAFDKYNQQN